MINDIKEKKEYIKLYIQQIIDIVDAFYYYDIDYDKLFLDIVKAITDNLDQYSCFIKKEDIVYHNAQNQRSVELFCPKAANINIIKIKGITCDTAGELIKISKIAKNGISTFIDLRNNPGGNINYLFDICNILVNYPARFSLKDKTGKEEFYEIKNYNEYFKIKGVIVDKTTFSAAEALAYMMKLNGIKIIGQKTCGKGVAQNLYKIYGGLLKITNKEFIPSNGCGFNGKGISPDIVIEDWDDSKVIMQLTELCDEHE